MNTVHSGEGERKARDFEPTFESRAEIIERAKNLHKDMLKLNPLFINLVSEYDFPTQQQMIIQGAANLIVPTDHDTLTLRPQTRGSEIVDPSIKKIHLRIALVIVPSEDERSEIEVPTNDVFIEVLKDDDVRELYLVNYGGAWRYNKVSDVIENPDADMRENSGDLFAVDPRVNQEAFTELDFESLVLALGMFQPGFEDNRSADI